MRGKLLGRHASSLLPFSSWLWSATSYTAADVQGALLKQIKASKKTTILVKKPQQEHIKFMDFGEPPSICGYFMVGWEEEKGSVQATSGLISWDMQWDA